MSENDPRVVPSADAPKPRHLHRSAQPLPRQSWRLLYLVSGGGSILFVVLLITALVIDFASPPPAHGGAATLEFIAGSKIGYVVEQILWILPNIFAVFVFVALYAALAPLDRSLTLIATLVGGLSWALFLAIPTTSRGALSLVYLSDRYAAAPSGERDVYATAAERSSPRTTPRQSSVCSPRWESCSSPW